MAYVRRPQEPINLTEDVMVDIIHANQSRFCTSYDIAVPNCYTSYDNEADLFAIRRSKLCDEFEVKLTRSDFLNDFKKIVNVRESSHQEWGVWNAACKGLTRDQVKKLVAPWQKLKHDALLSGDMKSNYFWYVVKEGVATLEDVPKPFGLATVDESGRIQVLRSAGRLHAEKITCEQELYIVKKLAYRFWDYRRGRRV
ncbi:hypothetical protein 13VV501A_gene0074 [Vibrio phage 13VV501A]|nr:hypothetical protein 13VV501A_gene0074 [Vibrio phage 13VV501A]